MVPKDRDPCRPAGGGGVRRFRNHDERQWVFDVVAHALVLNLSSAGAASVYSRFQRKTR